MFTRFAGPEDPCKEPVQGTRFVSQLQPSLNLIAQWTESLSRMFENKSAT